MSESNPLDCTRRSWLQSAMIAASLPLAALPLTAMSKTSVPVENDDEEVDDNDKRFKTKLETTFIGDHTTFAGLEPVVLEGVGLVRGLAGTGGDPAPSQYRSALMDDLKKDGYRNPNAILQSPNNAMVLVRAYLPSLMKKGERLDVELRIPESADASSLMGGELMEVRLCDKAIVGGTYMAGRPYAIARGPVLTAGLGTSANSEPALLKKGRVLSGAVVTKERELSLYLKNDFRSVRNAQRISEVIGRRFHHFDEHGIKKPLAVAKTDQRLVLKVHPRYKDNFPRYLQVIRHMAFRETPVEMRVRMNRLQHDLSTPESANSSALQLEAIGNDSIPILKQGLQAPMLECRFHSGVALAYLGDASGMPALVEAVKKERAFRVFALAAISALDEAEAHLALRELMNEPSDETRYGAFRSLWTLDRNDPFIRGEKLGIRDEEENADKHYALHVLHTEGPPLVHVTLRTRPEIVLFGADQEFSAPMYASAGRNIIVTAQPGSSTVTLAKFEVGKQDVRKEVSLKIADVIRAADELGATYPDILQLLADASKQKNLPTALATDKLPAAGRVYYRPSGKNSSGKGRPVKIGRDNFTPNIFPEIDDPDELARHKELEARESRAPRNGSEGPMASVPSELTDSVDSDMKSFKKKDSAKKKDDKSSDKKPWYWFGSNK